MDFGKLSDISKVDFTLPPDKEYNQNILKNNSVKTDWYFGPPVWANKDWVGKIYPQNAKDKDFLYHYTRQFNTIELNLTHYQIPTETTINRWKEVSVEGFKFCPKFPQIISHERQLMGCETLTMEFCNSILGLNEFLGQSFLQLSPNFEPKHSKILENYLKILPKELPVSIEFRHPNWFNNEKIWLETCQMLTAYNKGVVITDVAGRRDVLHQTFTVPTLALRFVGNELHPTDYSRINDWCIRLITWKKMGLEKAYIFVHCGENTLAPELTQYWIRKMNQLAGLSIQEPKIIPQVVQGSLF